MLEDSTRRRPKLISCRDDERLRTVDHQDDGISVVRDSATELFSSMVCTITTGLLLWNLLILINSSKKICGLLTMVPISPFSMYNNLCSSFTQHGRHELTSKSPDLFCFVERKARGKKKSKIPRNDRYKDHNASSGYMGDAR